MKYKNPFCVGALCVVVLVLVYLLFVPAMRVWGVECSDMVKINNSMLSAQAFDNRNDLKEKLMNLRHRSQIPTQFSNMSKHEYRYFLRGQIYAYACFLEMVEFQYTATMFGD